MKKYLKLYLLFIRYSIERAMMYKQDFFIWSAVIVGWFALTIVFYQVLFANVSEIAGWSKQDMLLLQGVFFIYNWFIWGVLWPNMRELPMKVNKGELDLELTRPVNTQFLISFKRFDLDNVNDALLGIGMIFYIFNQTGMYPSAIDVLCTLIALIAGGVFVYSTYFMTMCLVFYSDRIENLGFLFPSVRDIWRQPYTFYQGVIRFIITLVIPITLVTSTPASYLLKKPSGFHLLILVISAGVFLKLSNVIFKHAIKRYASASS